MLSKSLLGDVVILKLPLADNANKKEFYELFKIYDNILFYGIEDFLPFLQVVILARDKELIDDVKSYTDNVVEIDYSGLSRNSNTCY